MTLASIQGAASLSYTLGNFSAAGTSGQSTLYTDNAADNAIQIQILNSANAPVELQGSNLPPSNPVSTATGGGSWFALLFPPGYFTPRALSAITISSTTPNTGWATAVQTTTYVGTSYDLLVVYATEQVVISMNSIVTITLSGCAPTGSPSTAPADLGALFWNMNISGGSVTSDIGQAPQFWLLAKAANSRKFPPEKGAISYLPLSVDWTFATAGMWPGCDINSEDLYAVPNQVFGTPEVYPDVPNVASIALSLAGASGNVEIALTDNAVFTVTVLCTPSGSLPPLLELTNILVQPSDAANTTLCEIAPDVGKLPPPPPPLPPAWDTTSNGVVNGSLCSWTVTFPNTLAFVAGAPTILQLVNLVSKVAPVGETPGITAVAFSWSGLEQYADGLFSLPLQIVEPVPKALYLTPAINGSSADYAETIDIECLVYAAQSGSLSCTGMLQVPLTIASEIPVNSVQSIATLANPLSGNDRLSTSVTYELVANGSAQQSPPSVALPLTYTPPNLDGFATGVVTTVGQIYQFSTTLNFTAPLSGILEYCVYSTHGGQSSVGTSSTPPGPITVAGLGCGLTLNMIVPGGAVTIPCPVSSWSPVTPPDAGALVIFAFSPDTNSTATGPALYVWAVGMLAPLPMEQYFSGMTQPGYVVGYNKCANLRLVQWQPSQGSINVSTPNYITTMGDIWNCATFTVNWPDAGGPASITPPVTYSPLWSYDGNFDVAFMTGPFVMDGPPFPSNFVSANTFNGGPSPVNVMGWYSCEGEMLVGPATITWEAPSPENTVAVDGTNPFRGGFNYTGSDGATNCVFFSAGQQNTPAVSCGVEIPANTYAMDMDIDRANSRFVFSAAGPAAQGDGSTVQIYTAPWGETYSALPVNPPIPGVPTGASQLECYALCVGRETGTIYCVGATADQSSGLTVYMVAPGGGTPFPLFSMKGDNYINAANIFAMVVIEPPAQASQEAPR